ncbi:hypothetical protein KC921_00370 [Candidatus Woesebacteria bacterium]|nr:hypothetical protein [Candidatus Woesebacteria bacterium]
MRFFRYAVTFILLFLVGVAAFVIALQQFVLFQAQNQMLAEVSALQKSNNSAENYEYCRNLGTTQLDSTTPLYTTQLRFINDNEYVIEVICDQYEFSPKVSGQKKLPMFARKLPGSSGFVFGTDGVWQISLYAVPKEYESMFASIPLLHSLLYRTRTLTVEDGRLVTDATAQPDFASPATVCAGYGYQCCDQIQKVGLGTQLPGTDCSETCFQACQQRPIVLSFNADPGFDRYQRLLQASAGDRVVFNFVLDTLLPEASRVTLLFGDGQTWMGDGTAETVEHQYSCNTSECRFNVEVQVVDAYGVQSATTSATKMDVLVHR